MEERWDRRDRKLRKRRALSMVVSNRSMKTVILPMLGKRAAKATADGSAGMRRADDYSPRRGVR